MKTTLYIVFFILFVSFASEKQQQQIDIQITSNSTLYIKGSSNINTFVCRFNSTTLQRKLSINYKENGQEFIFNNTNLKLQNSGFDCGGKSINADFHKLLNTNEHPYIRFNLNRLTKNNIGYTAYITIEIAGVRNDYTVYFTSNQKNRTSLGKLKISITDFGLTPPKKMMGMIVVNENIEVLFDFDFLIET